MRVRRPFGPFPPAGHGGAASTLSHGRPAARACPHPPAATPVAAPRHPSSSGNVPSRIRPEPAAARAPAAAVQRPAPFRASPDHPRRFCPKRTLAAVPTARRWSAPSTALRVPPSRSREICPKRTGVAALAARRRFGPSAPLRAPPDRHRVICPERAAAVPASPRSSAPHRTIPGAFVRKHHPAHRHRAAARQNPSAAPAP